MTREEILAALAEPFAPDEVKFKPSVVTGNRALALAYVDARVVQDRLDQVVGVANWQDEYEFLPDGSVVCRLRLRLGDEWIMKCDVGGESEQKDAGDRRKAAVSDALKRAAVKFGVGRYLYRLVSQWCDYDPQKKQFRRTPVVPGSPRKAQATNGGATPAPAAAAAPALPPLPTTAAELVPWLSVIEAKMVKNQWCFEGDLYRHLTKVGSGRKYPAALADWHPDAVAFAVDETRRYRDARQAARKQVRALEAEQAAEADGVP